MVDADVVDSDVSVLATDVESGGGVGPSDGSALGWSLALVLLSWDEDERLVVVLLGDVPHVDAVLASGGEPLEVLVEGQVVDLGVGHVPPGWLGQVVGVPDSDLVVLSAGGDELTVGVQGQSVDVVLVGLDGSVELEDAVPDLQSAVSANGGVVAVLAGVGVPDLGDPVGVVVVVGDDLAVTEGVPDSDVLLEATREDLSVVVGEADGGDFLVVSDESAEALALVDIPESESSVPGAGDDVVVVAGHGQVSHEVVVTGEALGWVSEEAVVGALFVLALQVPGDDGLVSGSSDEHAVAARADADRSHSVVVAFKHAFELDCLFADVLVHLVFYVEGL